MAAKKSRKSSSCRFRSQAIILNILSRLSVKPLFRFKCASKAWLSLIDRNLTRKRALPSMLLGFYHRHRNWRPTPLKEHVFYLLNNTDHHDIDTKLSFLPCHTDAEIHDSCNGLLLLGYKEMYYVCNPATKRWTVLPYLRLRYAQSTYGQVSFPHYGQVSFPHYVRLAYDPHVSSSDYKVISITSFEIHIFSSAHRNVGWVAIDICSDPITMRAHCPNTVFSNGTLYISNEDRIIKYVPDQQLHRVILFPNDAFVTNPFLGILGGSICCASLFNHHLRVWTLIERRRNSNASWVLKHSSYVKKYACEFILAFDPFSDVIIIQIGSGEIWSYDINTRKEVNVALIDSTLDQGDAFQYTPCYTDAPKENYDCSLRAQVNRLSEDLAREKRLIAQRDEQIAKMKEEVESLRQARTPHDFGVSSSNGPLHYPGPFLQYPGHYPPYQNQQLQYQQPRPQQQGMQYQQHQYWQQQRH